jgi:hypothetical protein
MAGGQAVLIWFVGSGIACILLLTWAAIASLGTSPARKLGFILLAFTGALAVLPSGLGRLRHAYAFPFSMALFIGASLCLLSAMAVLWKLRRHPEVKRSADLGIAACLNLWLTLWVLISPFTFL